jgi:hypothetical protein
MYSERSYPEVKKEEGPPVGAKIARQRCWTKVGCINRLKKNCLLSPPIVNSLLFLKSVSLKYRSLVFHKFNCIEGKERHSNRKKGNLVCKINSNQYNFQNPLTPLFATYATPKLTMEKSTWKRQFVSWST